jgi:hypothetical protein
VRLAVTGSSRVEGRALVLSVGLRNGGDTTAAALQVTGELAGVRAQAPPADLPPASERAFELRYAADLARPGLYAVPLDLEFREGTGPDAPARSEIGYLVAPLGARPAPALGVHVGAARIEVMGRVVVGVESRDGAAHTARVELRTPRGVNVLDPAAEIRVPAGGRTETSFRVVRAGAVPGRSIGLVAIASVLEGPLQRDTVGDGRLSIRPREAWLPRLRRPLVAVAVGLLCAAVRVEWGRRRRSHGIDAAASPPGLPPS